MGPRRPMTQEDPMPPTPRTSEPPARRRARGDPAARLPAPDLDPTHDPGPEAARARIEAVYRDLVRSRPPTQIVEPALRG